MGKNALLRVRDASVTDSIRGFLRELFHKGLVDALLAPMELPGGTGVAQALIADPENLEKIDPLAPLMRVSAARTVSRLTKLEPSRKKIGVLLRPCELRALIELVKLNQASLENLFLIGIDCFGTCSPDDYAEFCRGKSSVGEEFLRMVASGSGPNLREACQVCEYPAPVNADMVIGLSGMDMEKELLLQATSLRGEEVLDTLGLYDADEQASEREAALSELIAIRTGERDKLFEKVQQEMTGLDNLLGVLSPCINCHNCRVACPICYCRECLLDSSTFEWEADKYLNWAEKRGAMKMPADTLLFHLTRLNHVSASCVGCGLCQDACPSNIPLLSIFRSVASRVQQMLDYVPGRSLDEDLPLTVFREDEFRELGEA